MNSISTQKWSTNEDRIFEKDDICKSIIIYNYIILLIIKSINNYQRLKIHLQKMY